MLCMVCLEISLLWYWIWKNNWFDEVSKGVSLGVSLGGCGKLVLFE